MRKHCTVATFYVDLIGAQLFALQVSESRTCSVAEYPQLTWSGPAIKESAIFTDPILPT
jgi:hypothetical protein